MRAPCEADLVTPYLLRASISGEKRHPLWRTPCLLVRSDSDHWDIHAFGYLQRGLKTVQKNFGTAEECPMTVECRSR